MPPSRQTTQQIPPPSIPSGKQNFQFPDSCHLLIATPRHVFAWDKSGVHSLFRSRRSSIVAAREAKDGSGVLAIASRNVVVLHDTKRGKDESWGLNADQEEVRHLEYSHDAKSLFLTTTCDGTVQRYDTESARMLDPAEKLPTAPVALAVSPTGHIVLSASHDPPVVFLKNLAHNTVSNSFHPNASAAPVSCAVFHPERPNVFLLAFRDGTVAAYDATKMPKRSPDQFSAKDGEISHLLNLHRVMVTGDSSLDRSTLASPIAGVAFLPGYKTRAVTAGRDGKCKIIDFASQGVILRSWHAKAPLTSISVFAMKPEVGRSVRGSRHSRASSSHTIGGPTTTESLIALGRIDGKIHIYDTVGLLLAQKAVSTSEEKIISVEWAKGSTPQAIDLGGVERHFSDSMSTSLRTTAVKKASPESQLSSPEKRKSSLQGSPKDLSVKDSSPANASAPIRKFTFHPDEVEEGTVRHIPAPQRSHPTGSAARGYDDLFSPVKADAIAPRASPQKRVTSPGMNRPRLSSRTFIRGPEAHLAQMPVEAGSSRHQAAFPSIGSHATSSGSTEKRRSNKPVIPQNSSRRVHPGSSLRSVRRPSVAPPGFQIGDGTASRNSTAIQLSSFNAKVLSDLRKLNGGKTASQYGSGTLSSYACPQRNVLEARTTVLTSGQSNEKAEHMKKRSVHLSNSETWPTDSACSSPNLADDDIWLTSEAEDNTNQQLRRRKQHMSRPPARRSSRSKCDHLGTTSTTAPHQIGSERQPLSSHAHQVDGSTEEETFPAQTHMSAAIPFSPASEELRELFPRSSSLSPHKKRGAKTRPIESSERRGLALTAIALNEAIGPPTKSPWARAKAGRRVPTVHKTAMQVTSRQRLDRNLVGQENAIPQGLARSPSYQCLVCPETTSRVQQLESEVALMKGEILAMKAVLRRNGLPFPACLR